MSSLFIEERYPRKSFAKNVTQDQLPYLIEVQKNSFKQFVDFDKNSSDKAHINRVFANFFPVESPSGLVKLDYLGYVLKPCMYEPRECINYNVSYAADLRLKLRLSTYEKDAKGKLRLKNAKKEETYFGELPLMTESGSFIINGTEKVVVSQLHRSPGVFFDSDKGRVQASGKVLYSARFIPYRGSWLDLELDANDCVFFRIDRRRKLPITALLRALDLNNEQVLNYFYDIDKLQIRKTGAVASFPLERLLGYYLSFNIEDADGKIVAEKHQVFTPRLLRRLETKKFKKINLDDTYLCTRIIAKPIIDPTTGEVIATENTKLTGEILERVRQNPKIKTIYVLGTNEFNKGDYIAKTLANFSLNDRLEGLYDIYRTIRPGEPLSKESSENLFNNLFFNEATYLLSEVGRIKVNESLNDFSRNDLVLTREDILGVIKKLLDIRDGIDQVDDIDSLSRRRIRSVGEMVENQLRLGLIRVEKNILDNLTKAETETVTPHECINGKSVMIFIRDFFNTGQLTQFMDQNNPLSELTHKRRITALGPGGLSRDRSGFEVRDVHPTHYGRLCPIETPEGPNIGLINSLASYAKLDQYGFLMTPYFKVSNKQVDMSEIVYHTVVDERDKVIAQADTSRDEFGKITDTVVSVRLNHEVLLRPPEEVELMEISPKQIVSVAASLIPFLEHDDANRALMGSNMQRQAVPCLKARQPLVGTGVEKIVAQDSGAAVIAKRSGKVINLDSSRIVIQADDLGTSEDDDVGIDIYNLVKYKKTNQNTCLNQTPLVAIGEQVKKGSVIADGPCIDRGHLALGQNMRIAFLSWNGYNFEDSILISEKVVYDETFSSIMVEQLSCTVRITKQGEEEITADIPNVSEAMLRKLDTSGIINIGEKVGPGDILVGKMTPKAETQLSPEEKLLRAVFGEKALDMREACLRVPPGMQGTVIDVQVYTREGKEKCQRALDIEDIEMRLIDKDEREELQALEHVYANLRKLLIGKLLVKGLKGGEKGSSIKSEDIANLKPEDLLKVEVSDNLETASLQDKLKKHREAIKNKYQKKRHIVKNTDELQPGVQVMVKVYVATKRRIQPGDKMAGRHGNKGVVSAIMPIEDMPYDKDGVPVDLILNPLGIPSRMNVGQVIECHLGLAAKGLGDKIGRMLDEKRKAAEIRKLILEIYKDQLKDSLADYTDEQILEIASNLREGVPMDTPVFDGAKESEIQDLLKIAELPESGQTILYDGRTGEAFDRPVTLGYMYILKLNHLVEDKMHARSTGSYSLVTQQPLGGKAQFGGQRLGEMEVWALEAYGAAYTLQEMLTVKSDDVEGRLKMYKNIVDGVLHVYHGIPESFNVLLREIRSLGVKIEVQE